METPQGTIDNIIFNSLKKESSAIANIDFILTKMNQDGHLKILLKSIKEIINKEMMYVTKKLEKIKEKKINFNIQTQMSNNIYIFKENLKLIAGYMSNIISRECLERYSR